MSLIGKKAPEFKANAVVDGDIVEFSSGQLHGHWSVVFFYPMDFTFVCPTEVLAFNEAKAKFDQLGCQVVGVSTDSEHTHWGWVNTPKDKGGLGENIRYPLVGDRSQEVSRRFDCLNAEEGVAYRGVYIMDPDYTVQAAIVNNLPVGRNVDEVLRTVKAFKFVTENEGKVCPANWNENADAMTPTHDGVGQYLTSH